MSARCINRISRACVWNCGNDQVDFILGWDSVSVGLIVSNKISFKRQIWEKWCGWHHYTFISD